MLVAEERRNGEGRRAADLDKRLAEATERSSEERWAAHLRSHADHDAVHDNEHQRERERIERGQEAVAAAFSAHKVEHADAKAAVDTALEAVRELADLHAQAHDREHHAHEMRHADQREAVDKAEQAVDKRLDSLQVLQLDRFEANRQRIEMLEKGDVKDEGRSLGQGAVVALIVGGVSFAALLLGLMLALGNLFSTPVIVP